MNQEINNFFILLSNIAKVFEIFQHNKVRTILFKKKEILVS